MTITEWVLIGAAIVGLIGGGGLLALSGRNDLPFEVPRPAPYVVLAAASVLLIVLFVLRMPS